jgi:hypothetical protein
LSTTQISLIREHTEIINPPRALWVPFELGRPLGAPNDPAFQSKVLISALRLLEASIGPVLEEFEEDAPFSENQPGPLACPVSFVRVHEGGDPTEQMLSAFKEEAAQMLAWYDLSVKQQGRTTVGATGLEPQEVAEFLADFVQGRRESNPVEGVSLDGALRMAAEDLKAYYLEAVIAQPGQSTDSAALVNWFWSETAAAKVINAVREICLGISDKKLQLLGKLLLVPRNQLHHFKS